MTDFNTALDAFIAGCQKIITENDERMFDNSPDHAAAEFNFGTKLEIDPKGRKYVRIVRTYNYAGRSVHCFVDKTNGNVLKGASWKAPAKGARGNIYNEDKGLGRMGPYGPGYNR